MTLAAMAEQEIQKAYPSTKAMNKLTKTNRINSKLTKSLQQPGKHLIRKEKEEGEGWG